MTSLMSQETNGQKPYATLQILGTAEDYSGVRGVLFADTYGVANLDDTKAVSYQWFADGDVISGATQQTLDVGDYFSLVENKDITVSLTYTDNASQQTTITSAEMPFGGFRIVANAEDGRNEWQWETVSEEVDISVNPYPLVESYSKNGTSNTSGTSAGSAHNITAVKASDEGFTAREGENVIRIYANGDKSNRSELAHLNNETKFQEGEEFYFSGSFYASREEWDPVTEDHSTVITQLKQYGGGDPNFELRLSNEGDYKMSWRAVPHDLTSHQDLGYATPDAWNDLKIYMKHSQDSDGIFQVWLNDQQVVDYQGSTMYRDADGYLKFGMYTEIFDERVLFWDAIDISDHLTTDFDTWLSSGNNLPSITLIGVTNNQQFEDSGSVVISGVANDPSGNQLGSTGGIQTVELFRNDVRLKSTTDENFSFSELNLDNGEHTLRVVVEDTDGNKAEEIVTVWVGNKPPVVLLENQGTLADHALAEQLTLSATAYDEDGSVSGVSFYVNDEMLDTVNTPIDGKYLLPWNSTTPGMYTFSARSFDDEGDIGVSQDRYVALGDHLKSLEILSSEDANIKPADPDYNGDWGELGVYGKESDPKVAILSFDVSELASAGAIRTAALDVYVTDLRTETKSTHQFSVYSTDNSEWDETTVTSENGPTKGTLVDTITIDVERETFSFDIATALKNALAAGSNNLTLWIEDANLNDDIREEFDFHSWKKDNPPKITVKYGEFSLNAQYNEGTQEIVVDNNGDHDNAQIDGGTNNAGAGTNNSTAGATRLFAIQDASIQENSSTNGNWSKNEVYGGSAPIVALVEFDLSSVSQGDKVQSATFSPYIRSLKDNPSSDFSIYSTSSKEWSQESVNWGTRPLKEELLDTVQITQSGSYVDFDVAKAVQQAIDNGQSTVTFWIEDSENEYQGFEFDSVNQNPDYPNEPQLNVVLGEFIGDADLADQDEAGNDVVTVSSTVVTNNSVSQSFKDVNSLQIVGSTVNDKDWDQHAGGGHLRADLPQLNDRDTSAVITFQWYADDLAISGATASDLILEDYNISSEAIHLVATYSTLSGEQVTVTSPTLEQGDWRIFSGGEDGTISGNNPVPFMETYSFSNSSRTHNGDGWYEGRILASDTHSITSVGAAETGLSAIEGDRIIRIAATEGSKRAELGNRNWNTRVQENQDLYISEKIYLPKEEWGVVTQYSTLIFQHKQYPGADPNFELRLSNEGNYKLFVQSPYGHYGLTGAKHNDHTIATLSPDRWHDLKIHLIPSQDDSLGQVTIYLDGETVFSGTGTNLNDRDNTNDSFLKLGMYTNIEDSRHYYVDAVEMSTFLPSTVNDWVTGDRQVSNTIADTAGSDLLVGTAQADNISAGEGADLVQAEAGNDTITLQSSDTWSSFYLARNVETNDQQALDRKTKYSTVIDAGDDADTLILSDSSTGDAFFLHDSYSGLHNSLTEIDDGLGRTTVARALNLETIKAGEGNDIVDLTSPTFDMGGIALTLEGEDGDDILWAAEGDDTLNGGAGNDVLFGGEGNDTLIGGSDADVFEFVSSTNTQTDTINDYSSDDKLKFYLASGQSELDQSNISNGNLVWNNLTIDLMGMDVTSLDQLNIVYDTI